VVIRDEGTVLDREQLRDITLDDTDLMREILTALIDDTSRQIPLLESAIREEDSQKCARLAHYSKGACANVGAAAAAAVLKTLERQAAGQDFRECSGSLSALIAELDRLRIEAREFGTA
jgi:HPt (histidine-containing phosphotransfer) domain-containing protein